MISYTQTQKKDMDNFNKILHVVDEGGTMDQLVNQCHDGAKYSLHFLRLLLVCSLYAKHPDITETVKAEKAYIRANQIRMMAAIKDSIADEYNYVWALMQHRKGNYSSDSKQFLYYQYNLYEKKVRERIINEKIDADCNNGTYNHSINIQNAVLYSKEAEKLNPGYASALMPLILVLIEHQVTIERLRAKQQDEIALSDLMKEKRYLSDRVQEFTALKGKIPDIDTILPKKLSFYHIDLDAALKHLNNAIKSQCELCEEVSDKDYISRLFDEIDGAMNM